MPQLLDAAHLVTTYGYIGLFITVFLESGVFFALPGDSLLFAVGLLSGSLGLNVLVLFLVSFVAAAAGGFVGYEIGRQIERLKRYALFRRILKDEHLKRGHEFFDKHGKFAIILARFMPVVRTFTPIAAGIVGMNMRHFAFYTVTSAAIWSGAFIFSGFFLGKIFPQLGNYLGLVVAVVVLLSITPAIYGWLKNRFSRAGE